MQYSAYAIFVYLTAPNNRVPYLFALGTLKMTTKQPIKPAAATTQSTTLLEMKKWMEQATIVLISTTTHTFVRGRIPPCSW